MSRRLRSGVLGVFLASLLGTAHAQQPLLLERQDRTSVPALAYAPASPTCRGIALISPGAGGSEQGYRHLGETLSALGYLTVVMGHPESGRRVLREHVRGSGLREGLADLITDPDAYHGRFMDIAASRQWARARCASGESLLVGHSMGAATVMMEAGARNRIGVRGNDAFDAYIALSPQGPGSIFPDDAWSRVRKPILLLTGTRDTELGGASWESRTEPFRNMPPGCAWLGVIDGASHMNFAGRGASHATETTIARAIDAFLAAVRHGDCKPSGPVVGLALTTK